MPLLGRIPIRFEARTFMAAVAGCMAVLVLVTRWRPLLAQAHYVLLAPGSVFSVFSLVIATAVAAMVIAVQRRRRGRRLGLALLRRALWPRGFFRGPSHRADFGFFALNTLATGAMIGWAVLSFSFLHSAVLHMLVARLGPAPHPALPAVAADCAMTLVLFLAYELAYWLDHYTSHHIRFFWEFHRVHHTAETLTPVTAWRVHPVELLKFGNMTMLVTAPLSATAHYALGNATNGWTLGGTNAVLIVCVCLVGHLQHSHVWIAFTGRLGRVIASPAHHQLHHSANPDHFGRNLGSMLAVFDWLFGTLLVPTRKRQALVYGVDSGLAQAHTVAGTLVVPFARAFASLARRGVDAPLGVESPLLPSGRNAQA